MARVHNHKNMLHTLYVICLTAEFSFLSVTGLEVTDLSVKGAVRAGEDHELTCNYTLSGGAGLQYMKWWFMPLDGTSKRTIYQTVIIDDNLNRTTYSSGVSQKDANTIVLSNMQPTTDSGVYECEVTDTEQEEKRDHHHVIVYSPGSGAVLNITKQAADSEEKTEALITCQATGVYPYPQLLITLDGANEPSTLNVSDSDGYFDVIANLTLNADAVDFKEVCCTLAFNGTHIPKFNDSCVSREEPSSVSHNDTGVFQEVDVTSGPTDSSNMVHHSWLLLLVLIFMQAFYIL